MNIKYKDYFIYTFDYLLGLMSEGQKLYDIHNPACLRNVFLSRVKAIQQDLVEICKGLL